MNPLMRAFRGGAGGGGGSSPGGVGLAALGGLGVNLGWSNYYHNVYPWINVLKKSPAFSTSGGSAWLSYTSGGYPTAVPNSTSIDRSVAFDLVPNYGYFPPGNYKARCTGGWTLSFVNNGSGLSNLTSGLNQATMTVADLGTTGDYSGVSFKVRATAPSSGGPHTLGDLQVYLVANESLLDSGEIFDPAFLSDLQGIKCIRTKDWNGIDGLNAAPGALGGRRNVVAYSELRQESDASWSIDSGNSPGAGGVPYSVCAKLAKKLNCALMFSVSMMECFVSCSWDTSGVFSAPGHELANGDPLCFIFGPPGGLANFTQYFARDVVAGVSLKVAATVGGTAIAITNSSSAYVCKMFTDAQYRALYAPIVAEMFAVAPGITLIPDAGNEVWNNAGPFSFHQSAYVLMILAGGGFAGSGYAWALRRIWNACETYYPRAQVVRQFSGQAYFFGNIGPLGYPYIDATATPLYPGVTTANLIDAHCFAPYVYLSFTADTTDGSGDNLLLAIQVDALSTYSAGTTYTSGKVVHMADGKNYKAITTTTGNSPPNASFWSLIETTDLIGQVSTWTDSQVNEIMTNGNIQAAAATATYMAAANAYKVLPFITYEGGMNGHADGNNAYSALGAFGERIKAWMGTTSFKDFNVDQFSRIYRANNGKLYTHYYAAGGWGGGPTNNSQATSYGFKRAHQIPATPAWTYAKSATL